MGDTAAQCHQHSPESPHPKPQPCLSIPLGKVAHLMPLYASLALLSLQNTSPVSKEQKLSKSLSKASPNGLSASHVTNQKISVQPHLFQTQLLQRHCTSAFFLGLPTQSKQREQQQGTLVGKQCCCKTSPRTVHHNAKLHHSFGCQQDRKPSWRCHLHFTIRRPCKEEGCKKAD